MKEVSGVIPRSAEVAQPGRALDSLPFAVRAKLKTESSPVQTRPSAPQCCFGISPGYFHFLFLKNFILSKSQMYSNPTSTSPWISLGVFATLQVNSSSFLYSISFVYNSVFLMFLCPSNRITWSMSLVLWYSVVAFQCRRVWKVICGILGFPKLWVALFRYLSKQRLRLFRSL